MTIAVHAGATGVVDEFQLGPESELDCASLERLAEDAGAPIDLAPHSRRLLRASAAALTEVAERGEAIYGLTTGFGPFVKYASAGCGDDRHGAGLLAHLGAGCGAMSPPNVVRATMIIRLGVLARGHSGVDPDVADALLALVRSGLTPAVPQIGSVGASGDLVPLSHIAAVLAGTGRVLDESGRAVACDGPMRAAGLVPIKLRGRDALALVNGTSFMSAWLALAVRRASRLIATAERTVGWIYRLLGARSQALDERLHRARGHGGQVVSAANIKAEAFRAGDPQDTSRPLQEIYSLRCAPQILGACRENLEFAARIVETEINGVSDNPVVIAAGGDDAAAVLHGGNFQGQQIAFAADALNAAITQAAVLAERLVDLLGNPQHNGGAPLLLAWEPGACSGIAGAQLTATAIVAEMRTHATPAAIQSIPTNGGNQDVVSMGTTASRAAYDQTQRLAHVLSILCISTAQLNHLRACGKAPGRTTTTPAWMPAYEPFDRDRALLDDIENVAAGLLA